jgi:hypothetical protein
MALAMGTLLADCIRGRVGRGLCDPSSSRIGWGMLGVMTGAAGFVGDEREVDRRLVSNSLTVGRSSFSNERQVSICYNFGGEKMVTRNSRAVDVEPPDVRT